MRAALPAVALAIFLTACTGQSQSSSSSTAGPAAATAGAMATSQAAAGASDTMTVKIVAENGSGESGTATLTRLGAKTHVAIAIKGESATGKQPAHVHKGTCAKLDPKPAYPLHDVVAGKSDTVIAASFDELTATPMAINIHESAANIGKYVACGDIL
jgi:prolyl-tRNA synthetase